MQKRELDCLIIGGGPAGLTAAVFGSVPTQRWCLRQRRKPSLPDQVIITPPSSMAFRATNCLPGVPITSSRITKLIRKGTDFVATHGGGEVSARSVLLASGIVDVHPEMHELDKAIKDGAVRYCPVCDGFDSIGKGGYSEDATSKARFLRTYSRTSPCCGNTRIPAQMLLFGTILPSRA
jgi:thioredoxin reductase (NADPH)